MAEGQKRGGFKKFKFFKFKGFESLSSIPRSFTLRRVSVVPSSPESLGMCLPPPQGFLEEAFDSTQDDLNTMPKGPSPYARSSDMYSHMGTMPRLSFGKVGKSLGKARGTQSCREKGSSRDKIPSTAPLPVPKALKMPGTLNLGKDPSSASGKAEQEKEEALPSGSPGAEKARMDQEIPGNSPSPGMEAPSPSLAPSPSAASGAETTDGDFQEKGQERPSESSPDSHHDGLESSSEYVKVKAGSCKTTSRRYADARPNRRSAAASLRSCEGAARARLQRAPSDPPREGSSRALCGGAAVAGV